MYCLVSPFSKSFDEIWLIYYVPDFLTSDIKIGQIVEIPYGKTIEIALVLNINVSLWSIDESKIKSLVSIKHNSIFLNNYEKEIIPWIAKYYFTPIHNAASLFFPKNLLEKVNKEKIPDFITKTEYNYSFAKDIILTEAQDNAYQEIKKVENKKILFYGITWSWKTEIYIKLIKEALEKWEQSLLLIPEIILSNQISTKIKEVFWEDVIIINSTVSAAKKTWYWCDIKTWKAKIILWTRSSIFYPFNNLWLIIVDEEHDNSYVSDQAPRYHSLDIVNYIANYLDIKLILASGTPSVTSMYKAIKWEYKLVNLLEKYKK